MSAQPTVEPLPPRLTVLPIPDRTAPIVPLEEPESCEPDGRQVAIPLELVPAGASRARGTTRVGTPAPRHRMPLPFDDEDAENRRCRPTGMDELRNWLVRLLPAMIEVSSGSRPAPQLMRWVSPAVYEALLRRHARAVHRGAAVRRPVRVMRVVLTEPAYGTVEASVVFADGPRVRAAALRMVGTDRRWIADAFVVG